ncbi:hypothetical protein KC845_02255 [Candidatus Kaiserbacteria bacterium]|nr:hypothetical protein [Candidatus Kaiserbacteria bacterium]
MSSTLQNLVALLGIIVLGAIGYYFYSQQDSVLTGTSVSGTSQASIEAAEFLSRLGELKAIELDDSLFNDARFRSLKEVRKQIVPVPIGRQNPFDVTN